jgi:hypothetical protein
VLLATKLHVPGPPGFVPRPRLADRLDEGLGRGLVLVCAPAGSGKTALLADDWARCGRRPVAWLSLDAGDNDPARFWRHAVAALDGLCPAAGRVGRRLSGCRAQADHHGERGELGGHERPRATAAGPLGSARRTGARSWRQRAAPRSRPLTADRNQHGAMRRGSLI